MIKEKQILLTDEEIPYKPDNEKEELWCDKGARDRLIYLEGAEAQLKKVVEWGEEECPHYLNMVKHECSDCWQQLLKETE